MTHFLAALQTDVRMLWRSGYIAATFFVFVVLLIVTSLIARIDFTGFADIMAAVALADLAISCSFLVGLMLLTERDEGSLVALAVTPISRWAYLASKTVSISVISTFQMILLVLLVYDGPVSLPFLFLGLFGVATIVTLLAFMIAVQYDTLFDFLLPVIGWGFVMSIPAGGILFDWQPALLDLHPVRPALLLVEAAFDEMPDARLNLGIVGTVLWTLIAAMIARWSFGKTLGFTARP